MGNPLTEGTLEERQAFVKENPIPEVTAALDDAPEEERKELAAFALEAEKSKGDDARPTFVKYLEGELADDADNKEEAGAKAEVTEDCKLIYESQLLELKKGEKFEGPLAAYLLNSGAPAKEL